MRSSSAAEIASAWASRSALRPLFDPAPASGLEGLLRLLNQPLLKTRVRRGSTLWLSSMHGRGFIPPAPGGSPRSFALWVIEAQPADTLRNYRHAAPLCHRPPHCGSTPPHLLFSIAIP